jgi:hypothetical protein
MSRALSIVILLAGCNNTLRGDLGFVAGRATVVPCVDKAGALLVVESYDACWPEALGERWICSDWAQYLDSSPQACSDAVVFDSPSAHTLTAYFDEPFDRSNMLGSATTTLYDLPCNPRGRGADYDDFDQFVSVYAGDVRITKDRDATALVDIEVYPVDEELEPVFGDDAAMHGRLSVDVCR